MLFCVALVFFFERLGDEYFSWWYVQHMLPYDTGISLYSILYCDCFCPVFIIFIFYLVLKCQIKIVSGASISYYFAIFFTTAIPKGLTFGLCLYILRLCNVHVLYSVQLV